MGEKNLCPSSITIWMISKKLACQSIFLFLIFGLASMALVMIHSVEFSFGLNMYFTGQQENLPLGIANLYHEYSILHINISWQQCIMSEWN